jgi:hypothetical protein
MVLPIISVEILEEVAGAVAALGLGALGKNAGTLLAERMSSLTERIFSFQRSKTSPNSTGDLLTRLHSASSEMESVLGELRTTADERLKKVSALEASINELIEKEKKLQEKIQGTEGLSKATVEAIAQVVGEKLEKAERPKRRRDYVLFAAGVIVTAVIGVGIEATKPLWERALPFQVESSVTDVSHGKAVGASQPQITQPNNSK